MSPSPSSRPPRSPPRTPPEPKASRRRCIDSGSAARTGGGSARARAQEAALLKRRTGGVHETRCAGVDGSAVGFLSGGAGNGTSVCRPDRVHPRGSGIPLSGGFSLEAVMETMSQQMEMQSNSTSKLLDQAVKGQQFMSPVSVLPEMIALKVFDDLPRWDDDATLAIQEDSLADVIWDDGRGCYSSKDEVGPFLEFSEGTPLPVFDETPLEDVVWDEEIGHHISYRGGLLEQLAEGGQFMGSEEIMMEVSLSPSELIPRDGRVALFSPEAARYGDHLVLDEMPSANVVWDNVMSSDCGPWHGSLEELEQCDHYSVDEKTKPVFKLDVDVKPPHVASDEISCKVQWDDEQLPDQVAEIATKMVRDMELLHDLNLHNDLLQPLTLGVVLMDKEKAVLPIKLNINEVLTHECRPSLILESDGHDADQMLDKASKHGMIELTHFSAVQLELVNDSVHENATASTGTQAVSVSDQRSIFMVTLVFKSAANRVFNKLPAWSHGNFSPGESEQQLLSCRMNSRQWDPGIIQLIIMQGRGGEYKWCIGGYSETTGYEVVCKGCKTATAWGQAVFRGDGNVMTRIRPMRSPAHVLKSQPEASPTRAPIQVSSRSYKTERQQQASGKTEIEKQNRVIPFLRRFSSEERFR